MAGAMTSRGNSGSKRSSRDRRTDADGARNGRSPAESEVAATLERAELHLHSGDLEQTLSLCRRVLDRDADHPAALHLAGLASFQSGDPEQGLALLHRAADRAADDAAAHYNLGVALAASGRLAEAQAAYRRALAINPDHIGARLNLGNALKGLDQPEAAAGAYRRVLKIEADNADALFNLGAILQEQGELGEAASLYRRAIEHAPSDDPSTRVVLGNLYLRMGDPRAALECCEVYLSNTPYNPSVLALKGFVLRELDDHVAADALIDFDRLLWSRRCEAPDGYPSMTAFNAALAQHVLAHPTLDYGVGGVWDARLSGDLLTETEGPLAHLESMIVDAVDDYLLCHSVDPAHPFLARRPQRLHLTAWAIVLEGRGYDLPHIHPAAWLSGVYYVALPAIVGAGDGRQAGWMEFGRPPKEFHLTAEAVVHAVQPQEGSLLLFPSYFYHRVVPATTPEPRISIAFDLRPEN